MHMGKAGGTPDNHRRSGGIGGVNGRRSRAFSEPARVPQGRTVQPQSQQLGLHHRRHRDRDDARAQSPIARFDRVQAARAAQRAHGRLLLHAVRPQGAPAGVHRAGRRAAAVLGGRRRDGGGSRGRVRHPDDAELGDRAAAGGGREARAEGRQDLPALCARRRQVRRRLLQALAGRGLRAAVLLHGRPRALFAARARPGEALFALVRPQPGRARHPGFARLGADRALPQAPSGSDHHHQGHPDRRGRADRARFRASAAST